MRVLLTRPSEQAGASARRLEKLGHEVIAAPVLEIRNLPFTVPQGPVQALAVTSRNGAAALAQGLADGAVPGSWLNLPVFAVGERTGAAMRKAGFCDVQVPPDAGGAQPLAGFARRQLREDAGALVHVRGRDSAGDLAGELSRAGLSMLSVIAYAAEPADALPLPALAALQAGRIDAVLLYSPRSAQAFLALAGDIPAVADGPMRFLCLSPAVAAMMAEKIAPARIAVAKSPDESALFALFGTSAAGAGLKPAP